MGIFVFWDVQMQIPAVCRHQAAAQKTPGANSARTGVFDTTENIT